MSTEVGSADIELHADASALTPEAKRAAKEAARAASGEKVGFEAELDSKAVRREAKRAAEQASFRSRVEFDAELDTGRLLAEAKAAARAAKQTVEFDVDLDRAGIRRMGDGFRNAKGEALDFGSVIEALAKPLQRTSKAADGLGKASDGAADGLRLMLGPLSFGAKDPKVLAGILVAVAAAAKAAVPFIVGLAGGLVALAGAIAEAAFAAVSAAAPIAALGVAALTTKIGMSGMDDAFKAVAKSNKEMAETGKVSEETMAKQEAALKRLAPAAKQFVLAVESVRPAWERLTKAVQGQLFEGLGAQLKETSKTLLPALGTALGGIAAQINDAASGFLRWAGAEANVSRLTGLIDGLRPILGSLLRAAGAVGDGLLTMLTGALPSGARLSQTIEGWGKSFQTWATSVTKSGSFQEFIDHAMDVAGTLWGIIKNIGSSIATVFGAGAPTGEGFLKTIEDATGKFAAFLKTPEGQAKLDTWFKDAKQAFKDLGAALKLAGPIIEDVFTWWRENGKQVSDDFNRAAPIIEKVAEALILLNDWNNKSFAEGMTDIGTALDGVAADIDGWIVKTRTKFTGWVSDTAASFEGWVNETSQKFIDWVNETQARFTAWVASLPGKLAGLATKLWEGAGDLASSFGEWVSTTSRQLYLWILTLPPKMVGLAQRLWEGAGDLVSSFGTWLSGVPGRLATFIAGLPSAAAGLASRIWTAAGNLASAFATWVSTLPGRMVVLITRLVASAAGLAGRIITAAGSLAARFATWVATLPGKAADAAAGIIRGFADLAGRMIRGAGDIASRVGTWLSKLPGRAAEAAGNMADEFSKIPGRIVGYFKGLAGDIVAAIGTIVPKIRMPHIGSGFEAAKTAMGGVFDSPQVRLIGEAGPEAVVPLRRNAPLAPDVAQLLRSVAAGHGMGGGAAIGGAVIDGPPVTINVQLPTGDPQAAAMAVMNRLATRLAV